MHEEENIRDFYDELFKNDSYFKAKEIEVEAEAIYGSFCKAENEISNVVNYKITNYYNSSIVQQKKEETGLFLNFPVMETYIKITS